MGGSSHSLDQLEAWYGGHIEDLAQVRLGTEPGTEVPGSDKLGSFVGGDTLGRGLVEGRGRFQE